MWSCIKTLVKETYFSTIWHIRWLLQQTDSFPDLLFVCKPFIMNLTDTPGKPNNKILSTKQALHS